jgi:hypothetical protein
MPAHGSEIPDDERIAVIVLRLLCGLRFIAIAEKLQLKLALYSFIYNRTLQRIESNPRDSARLISKAPVSCPVPGVHVRW